jgi:hypothetical protein
MDAMRLFVIRGFGTHTDFSGAEINFDQVHDVLIRPAMERCGLEGGTTGQVVEAGNIREDMFALIIEADVVICDITIHNANVFYELGIRHALRKKHTVLIKGDPTADKTPFDLSTDRYLKYPVGNPAAALDDLVATIRAGLNGPRETDSPVFKLLPHLPEADPSDVTVVPLEFAEEVARAEASHDKGCLRLLAEEVRGEPFRRDGLKLIARAQWSLKDYAGSRASWETVRNAATGDIEANLALANIYERLHREKPQQGLLAASNQAILRVLVNESTSLYQRAEALALQGRNLKTLWRLEFDRLETVEARRYRALDRKLLQSYEAYRSAFYVDLNNVYPGISALQTGMILQDLSSQDGWPNMFGGDTVRAQRFREDLETGLVSLRFVVTASVVRARERAVGEGLMWADISEADLLFLTSGIATGQDDAEAVVSAYQDAIPQGKAFAWDATRGQLELFATLGIKAGLAKNAIQGMDARFESSKPVHLVVFSGHTVDAPHADSPRFPATIRAEAKAQDMIRDRLEGLRRRDEELVVLASAAPGADILMHEVCAELGVKSVLCLPMPAPVVACEVFKNNHPWLARFRAVVRSHENNRDTLVLGNEADDGQLPRWRRSGTGDVWERGNRWVIKNAESWEAQQKTMMALWDGAPAGNATGGTAFMVQLAQQSGLFDIMTVDSKGLLSQET